MQYKHLSPTALWPVGDKSRKDYRRVCDSLPSSIYRIAMWIFFLWLFISCCGRCAWRLFLPPHPFCSGMLRRVRLSASSVILYTLFYLSLFCYPSPILPWDFICYPFLLALFVVLSSIFCFTLPIPLFGRCIYLYLKKSNTFLQSLPETLFPCLQSFFTWDFCYTYECYPWSFILCGARLVSAPEMFSYWERSSRTLSFSYWDIVFFLKTMQRYYVCRYPTIFGLEFLAWQSGFLTYIKLLCANTPVLCSHTKVLLDLSRRMTSPERA